MQSKSKKTVGGRNWYFLIPQIAFFLFLSIILQQAGVTKFWLLSVAIFSLLNGYLKVIIPRYHRKGLYYVRKGEFEGAIYAFNASNAFFNKYRWIDNNRSITLLSLSAFSYREMALMNIIYCYQQLGRIEDAKEVQGKLRKEFPNNPYAE